MLPDWQTILREKCRLDPHRLIVVGVSGGADSLCLMDVLRQAGYLILVGHFNHQLREEATREAAAVEQMVRRLGLPVVVEGADVRAFARQQSLSLEEAARVLRYRFLFGLARQHQAQAVAVGHTADDQVETVLMHLLRGAGLRGLRGMAYRTILPLFDDRIPLVRPLLDLWREETQLYCASRGLRPLLDPSNESLNFLRNRIRHLLIPTLETYNPKVRVVVWRMAQALNADYEIILQVVDEAWKHTVLSQAEGLVIFDATALVALSENVRRHLFRRAIEHISPTADVRYAVLERMEAFWNAGTGILFLPGGIRVLREGEQVFVVGERAMLPFERWPQLPAGTDVLPVQLPCQVELAGGWQFVAEPWNIPALAIEQMQHNQDRFQVWLDADALQGELMLRVRREGDRFAPLSLGGHSQKLSDFFINVKLPRRARARWPLLCAGEQIAWVPGYQPAYPFRVTPSSRHIWYFALHPPRHASPSSQA